MDRARPEIHIERRGPANSIQDTTFPDLLDVHNRRRVPPANPDLGRRVVELDQIRKMLAILGLRVDEAESVRPSVVCVLERNPKPPN